MNSNAQSDKRSTDQGDGKLLDRVRSLLAKAESTEFPDEAEALTAKAQELMAKYALDEALLGHEAGAVVRVDIVIEDPYASAKSSLLGAVSAANRCKAVWMSSTNTCSLFGVASDIETAELLFTSLLLQATRSMSAAGPQRDAAGRSRTKSFRRAFLLGYASRISQRLQAATAEASRQAERDSHASPGALVPLLAARLKEVDDAVKETFGQLGKHRPTVSNGGGFFRGQEAADQSDIHAAARLARNDAALNNG